MRKPRTIISADGKTVKLRVRLWSETFPAADIDGKVALYRRLTVRKGGKYASEYSPTLEALIAVSGRISASERVLEGNL